MKGEINLTLMPHTNDGHKNTLDPSLAAWCVPTAWMFLLMTILRMSRSCAPTIFPSSRMFRGTCCSLFKVRGSGEVECLLCNSVRMADLALLGMLAVQGGERLQRVARLIPATDALSIQLLLDSLYRSKFPQQTCVSITVSESFLWPYQTVIHLGLRAWWGVAAQMVKLLALRLPPPGAVWLATIHTSENLGGTSVGWFHSCALCIM
ncbi:unnamed protein product [Nyctereutes procyonoides]|uniref:(raccoon dog) hypothetical protein n=1 Tax=Nyctereutes procyonoides TaxID=34880 RepID=A0A811Z8B9_NYCPR|nr:unnamed protein product [Nyctereutes procyonoides]